jgi:subtilase family serine protease
VAFESYASNLVPDDTTGTRDVFVHDRQTGATELVSVDSSGNQGNGDSEVRAISGDGRYVAFLSFASNLVPGDTNGFIDVFVHDRQTGQTTRVSVDSSGNQGNGDSYEPKISADGRYVTFDSLASNLVPDDTNGKYDVFVRDRGLPAPDLVETSVSNPPVSQNGGTSFSVTDTAKNQGGAAAAPSKTRYYLSLDTVRNAGDKALTGTRAVPGLASGQSSTGSKTVTIQTSTAPGTYYLLACADDTLLVPESDETNNCIASVATIQVTAPDLVETAVSKPPASVNQGGSFNVTDTAKNAGAGPAGASTTRYYLSLDKTKSAGDVLLTGSRAVPALTPSGTSAGTVSVTVPVGTSAGSYYLLACADDLKVVNESKEGNNCRASATTIKIVP